MRRKTEKPLLDAVTNDELVQLESALDDEPQKFTQVTCQIDALENRPLQDER